MGDLLQNWRTAQKLEYEYQLNKEDASYNIEYGLKFWGKLLRIDLEKVGEAVEVGCGRHGISRFKESIVGLDSLPFKGGNFVMGVSEHLPFRRTPLVISCNVLDHVRDPEQSVKEMGQITDKIVLSVYTFNKIVRDIIVLVHYDVMHPHHLTEGELLEIFQRQGLKIVFSAVDSPMRSWKLTMSWIVRIKMLLGHLSGARFRCYHLESRDREIKEYLDLKTRERVSRLKWLKHTEERRRL